jgi:hypothetical protein
MMTICAKAFAAAKAKEADIKGDGEIKRIKMCPFRVDLGSTTRTSFSHVEAVVYIFTLRGVAT